MTDSKLFHASIISYTSNPFFNSYSICSSSFFQTLSRLSPLTCDVDRTSSILFSISLSCFPLPVRWRGPPVFCPRFLEVLPLTHDVDRTSSILSLISLSCFSLPVMRRGPPVFCHRFLWVAPPYLWWGEDLQYFVRDFLGLLPLTHDVDRTTSILSLISWVAPPYLWCGENFQYFVLDFLELPLVARAFNDQQVFPFLQIRLLFGRHDSQELVLQAK